MNTERCYSEARDYYAALGGDTEAAIEKTLSLPVSLHCWQLDDVRGFEGAAALEGGIQTTGNYPGAATNPEELLSDMEFALKFLPGKTRINLHASYAIFEKGMPRADRDALLPEHFAAWTEFAKKHGLAIDFNPTFFSHPMVKDGLTLSSPDENVRAFWIRHGIACIRIAEYFARETGKQCLLNFWMPDGLKETPADRYSPRSRMADSLDRILAAGYDKSLVAVSLESKVFGIGLESYTVGSAEFCTSYSIKNGLVPLMDNGHYHPTESVADKISSMLLFSEKVALHVTRAVRWDSDHVTRFDDEIREIALEIVRGGPERFFLALDYFDASINRLAAWITGYRAFRKALLWASVWPIKELAAAQEANDFTSVLVKSEEIKTAPFSLVWAEYCRRADVPADASWLNPVLDYEKAILPSRTNR
ncbi:MAG: L-rhamnose isomerase [Clostridia bacterium]|nr:L-rhamnose isomerase [Clostridia bacterium]